MTVATPLIFSHSFSVSLCLLFRSLILVRTLRLCVSKANVLPYWPAGRCAPTDDQRIRAARFASTS